MSRAGVKVWARTIVFALVSIPMALAILIFVPGLSFTLSTRDWLLAILFGALIGIGGLITFAAYRWGKASVVTAIIGLYPALVVLLAVPLLAEKLNKLRIVSVILALTAGAALSSESEVPVIAKLDGANEISETCKTPVL